MNSKSRFPLNTYLKSW